MNELSSLGLILLLALLAGHLVKFLRIPEVTGYILAGVALGPSALGWITDENLATLSVFSEVALGLILFSIGSVFEFSRFRRVGRQIVLLAVVESSLAALLVSLCFLMAGLSWQVALLLGAIAMETAVASTLMVIRESNASGPLSETLTNIIAVNNIFCLIGYSFVTAVVDLELSLRNTTPFLYSAYTSIYPLIWQVVGSVALGYLVGLLLASWAYKVVEHGEMLILLSGCVLLCVGLAFVLELSPLLSSLAVGATMANLSGRSGPLFAALSRTDPPLYAIFFVIAGADLDISLLGSIGILGIVYVLARTGAKVLGSSVGAYWLDFHPTVRRLLGFGMVSQTGLANGSALAIQRRFSEYCPVVTTVIIFSIIIFEIIGPICTRFALVRSGEAQPRPRETQEVLE